MVIRSMSSRILKVSAIIVAVSIVIAISAYITLMMIIKSPDTVVVPDLVGKDAVQALKMLTGLGLNTKIDESEYSAAHPRDHVIFQEPEAGAEVKKGRDVRIIVSKGVQVVIVPDFLQSTLRQARLLLADNGLCLGDISYTNLEKYRKDQIIAQSPPEGSDLKRGACVSFLVSMGPLPRAIVMPDLQGLPPDDAIVEIELNNLTLGEISAYHQDGTPLDTIIGQKPLSGGRVLEGTAVDLVRNRPTDSRQVDRVRPLGSGHLFRYRLDSGYLKRRIRIQIDVSGISLDLFYGFAKPDEEIWCIIPREDDAAVSLYEDGDLVSRRAYDTW